MIDVPPRVAAKAVELGLGDCEHRFRRRPGIPAVIGILAFTALPVMLLQVDPVQALGVVLFVRIPVVAWWAVTMSRKWRGGLYVFTNGFADVHGRRIKIAATWDEVEEMDERRTLRVFAILPFAWGQTCAVHLRGRIKALHMDTTVVGLKRALHLVRLRTRTFRTRHR